MAAIEARDLKKYYGPTRAVDGISFDVEGGEVFGMLGPNGAGKTTTTEILEGLRAPDAGTVRLLGHDVQREARAVKEQIGIQLQTTALYPRLTVREILELFRTFFSGETRTADELIDLVDLREKERTRTRDLSSGQKQRLSLALALVNRPKVVFLDEPTTGLDPQARRNVWEIVRRVRQGGATVFLTTHYMEEAQTLCDRVAVVDAGKVIALDTPDALIDQNFRESIIELDLTAGAAVEAAIRSLPGVTRFERREGRGATVYTAELAATLGGLTRLGEAGKVGLDSLLVRRATLEDVFLKLTGKRIRE